MGNLYKIGLNNFKGGVCGVEVVWGRGGGVRVGGMGIEFAVFVGCVLSVCIFHNQKMHFYLINTSTINYIQPYL